MKKSDSLPALLKPVEPPAVLYHYTSLEGLLGILGSGMFWASDVRFLNDSTEGQLVRRRLLDEIAKGLHPEWKGDMNLVGMLINPPRQHFALCLSELDDDLGQWRAYCPNGRGVCVGIEPKSLVSCNTAQCNEGAIEGTVRTRLNKIAYVHESITSVVKETMQWMGTDKLSAGTLRNAQISGICDYVNTFVKHPSFRSESEWRLAVDYPLPDFTEPSPPKPVVHFRQGNSTLVPYLRIKPGDEPYFVKSVRMGPSPDIQLSMLSLKAYFESIGRDISISGSSIPFRQW